jgi:hypothetical protein
MPIAGAKGGLNNSFRNAEYPYKKRTNCYDGEMIAVKAKEQNMPISE